MVKPLPVYHTPQSCHWSVLTILMPWPYWLSASDSPWCCWNDHDIWLLSTTETCRSCPLWKPRQASFGGVDALPPSGASPYHEQPGEEPRPDPSDTEL